MLLPTTIDLTPLQHSQNQKIALSWAIKDFLIVPENNPYDPKALAVYKVDKQGMKFHIGYVRKNRYQYTKKAESLYDEYQCRVFELRDNGTSENEAYQTAQKEYRSKPGWGEKEPVAIWTEEQLENIVTHQNKYKLLTDRSEDKWGLYLQLTDTYNEQENDDV